MIEHESQTDDVIHWVDFYGNSNNNNTENKDADKYDGIYDIFDC